MAVDATARLYDVDEDTVVFKRLKATEKYDQGVFTFRARKGKLIDLDKLHESIWATRLSGGTRSGLVQLKVSAIGKVTRDKKSFALRVMGTDRTFQLAADSEEGKTEPYEQLVRSMTDSEQVVKVTGVIDNYQGRWPNVLRKKPPKVRTLLVTEFIVVD